MSFNEERNSQTSSKSQTSFGWKRKLSNVSFKDAVFSSDDEDVNSGDANKTESVWVKNYKKSKKLSEAHRKEKFEKWKVLGSECAQQQNFQKAIKYWNLALELFPYDATVLEMEAQAYLQLDSPFSAIEAVNKAIKCNPVWWVSYQTLGRAYLDIGDINEAKINFSKAIHLNPVERELWDEDLKWTLQLITQMKTKPVAKKEEHICPTLVFDM